MLSKLLTKFPNLALAVPAEEIVWRPNYIFPLPAQPTGDGVIPERERKD